MAYNDKKIKKRLERILSSINVRVIRILIQMIAGMIEKLSKRLKE